MSRIQNNEQSWMAQVRACFFEVSGENVLVYQDPIIGPLSHPGRQLAVIANEAKGRFELHLQGRIEEVFEFGIHAGLAGRRACHAYFRRFENCCVNDDRERMVA